MRNNQNIEEYIRDHLSNKFGNKFLSRTKIPRTEDLSKYSTGHLRENNPLLFTYSEFFNDSNIFYGRRIKDIENLIGIKRELVTSLSKLIGLRLFIEDRSYKLSSLAEEPKCLSLTIKSSNKHHHSVECKDFSYKCVPLSIEKDSSPAELLNLMFNACSPYEASLFDPNI